VDGADVRASIEQPPTDNRAFLLNAAAWQDSLLQSYRTQFLSFQGLLFAFGVALLIAALPEKPPAACGVSVLVLIVAVIGACANRRLGDVLKSRSEDVDFWHEKLILYERQLPLEERIFTYFKCFQMAREVLTDKRQSIQCSADELARAGLGYTREVITPVFGRVQLVAWVLLAVAALSRAAVAITSF
jgi:hypothetical protein